jgi:hypothetical protein
MINEPALLLFTAFHKAFPVPAADFVYPVKAGKALSDGLPDMTGDNTGENISELNTYYAELTVIYWIWKNFDRNLEKYWGINHYRRYFCLDPVFSLKKRKVYNFSEAGNSLNKVLTKRLYTRLLRDLEEFDVILPRQMHCFKKRGRVKSIARHYAEEHNNADWEITLQVIREKYPEYEKSFVVFDGSKMSFFNMMVTSWAVWDHYLQWLFDILFEVDKRIVRPEDAYQCRVFGFLSERLINLFVYHNNYSVKYYPVAAFNKP